jgi:hypothetical protein
MLKFPVWVEKYCLDCGKCCSGLYPLSAVLEFAGWKLEF